MKRKCTIRKYNEIFRKNNKRMILDCKYIKIHKWKLYIVLSVALTFSNSIISFFMSWRICFSWFFRSSFISISVISSNCCIFVSIIESAIWSAFFCFSICQLTWGCCSPFLYPYLHIVWNVSFGITQRLELCVWETRAVVLVCNNNPRSIFVSGVVLFNIR